MKFEDSREGNSETMTKPEFGIRKATIRQVSALMLACLIILGLSGCRLPPASSIAQTTAGTPSVQTTKKTGISNGATTVSTLPASAVRLIQDFGSTDVKKNRDDCRSSRKN
jgi:hypothetical protein